MSSYMLGEISSLREASSTKLAFKRLQAFMDPHVVENVPRTLELFIAAEVLSYVSYTKSVSFICGFRQALQINNTRILKQRKCCGSVTSR